MNIYPWYLCGYQKSTVFVKTKLGYFVAFQLNLQMPLKNHTKPTVYFLKFQLDHGHFQIQGKMRISMNGKMSNYQ